MCQGKVQFAMHSYYFESDAVVFLYYFLLARVCKKVNRKGNIGIQKNMYQKKTLSVMYLVNQPWHIYQMCNNLVQFCAVKQRVLCSFVKCLGVKPSSPQSRVEPQRESLDSPLAGVKARFPLPSGHKQTFYMMQGRYRVKITRKQACDMSGKAVLKSIQPKGKHDWGSIFYRLRFNEEN